MNKKEQNNRKYFNTQDIFRKIEKKFKNLNSIDSFNKSLKNVFNKIY